MNIEMRELTFDEIDQVSGGDGRYPVPGGEVVVAGGYTNMHFGNTTIEVGPGGSLSTYTVTHPPRPA